MNRVFYFSGHCMTVFHWKAKEFIGEYSFSVEASGLNKFEHYLLNSPSESSYILLDVIEEEYVEDTLPHVSSKDRHAILQRRIKRDYPESGQWFNSRVMGRETDGRRDDKVIYSVQTNPSLLEPWLQIIRKQKVPIAGIWSLAILSEKLINLMDIKDENILLLSQQAPSRLRQSFFKSGILQSSRSVVINRKDIPIADQMVEELNQTSNYLFNKKYIDVDEVIMVHVICSKNEVNTLKAILKDSRSRKYHYHNLEDIIKKFEGVPKRADYCHAVFAKLCSMQLWNKGQYGNNEIFKYWYKNIVSSVINVSSITIVVISCLLVIYYQAEAKQIKEEIAISRLYTKNIEDNYKKSFSDTEKDSERSASIQSMILFYQQLEKSRQVSPEIALTLVSSILKNYGVSDIEITGIKWLKVDADSLQKTTEKNASLINYHNTIKYYHRLNIRGYLGSVNDSVESIVKKTKTLKTALESNPYISKIDFKKSPIDIRPDKNFIYMSGKNDGLAGKWNTFEIELLVKT